MKVISPITIDISEYWTLAVVVHTLAGSDDISGSYHQECLGAVKTQIIAYVNLKKCISLF